MKEKYSLIFSTFPSKEKAKEVSRILVEENLIACSTIIPAHLSIYKWEGKVQEDKEFLCIFKTKEKNYEKVEKRLKEIHPYKVPEILMVEVKKGFKEYLKWIDELIGEKL